MIIVGSTNANVGLDLGWQILQDGGSALDAVEAATRPVEDNPADHTVGYGGYPNLLGVVELDASIMDGTTRKVGAVGALRGYRHPISIARRVLEDLPHVLLVGDGAARFAQEIGMQAEDLLSPEAEAAWRAGIEGRLPPEYLDGAGIITTLLSRATGLATDPEKVAGTVNVIAQDAQGRIASAVSTSGWAWKYPGRLGDSPIVGAGNYADDRYGAAGCTGWGELAMRAGTARTVILLLQSGMSLEAACRTAFQDLAGLAPAEQILMNMVAIDHHGNHCGVSSAEDKTYIFRTTGMSTYTEAPRLFVPVS